MKANLMLFAAIALVALIGSVLLVPQQGELALMHFRTKQFDDARTIYEQQIAAGSLQQSTVKPLAELYLEQGEIDRAVALLERYLAASPDSPEVLERLKQYYGDAQRRADYIGALARLTKLRPSEANLRELAHELAFASRWDELVPVLEQLVDQRLATAADYEQLARLLAARNLRGSALAALDELEGRDPKAIDASMAGLSLDLAISLAGVEAALPRARRWLDANPDPAQALSVAGTFTRAQRLDLALSLLRPYAEIAAEYPDLIEGLVTSETDAGNTDRARDLMAAARRQGRLPAGLEIAYVDALLANRQLEQAIAEAQSIGLQRMSRRLLRALVEQALAAKQPLLAQDLVNRLGEGFLARRPTLGAELALVRGDLAAAKQWIVRAELRRDLAPEDQFALARLLVRFDRAPEALARMAVLTQDPATTDAALGNLASLYLELDRGAEGLALFDTLRRRQPREGVGFAWARLAAANGRAGEVLQWLQAGADPPRLVLAELSSAARSAAARPTPDPHAAILALISSERLMAQNPTPDDRLRYAQALLVNRRPAEAAVQLALLVPGNEEAEIAYAAALSATGETARLVAFWGNRLADPTLGAARRADLVYGLLDLKAYETALPTLRELAAGGGDMWLYAYADAARSTGAGAELADYLVAALAHRLPDAKAREARIYLLAEVAPERAARALAELARAEPELYADAYADLLARLGRREELTAFLTGRLAEPKLAYETRAAVVYRLLDLGAFELALGPLEVLARVRGGEWVYAFADTAQRAGQLDRLATFLQAELARADLPPADRDARTYLLAERAPRQALAAMTLLAGQDPERWGDAYLSMLQQLQRKDEIVAFLRADLDRKLPPARRDARLFALIDAGGPAVALPYMRRLAEQAVGQWGLAYEDALRKLGRRDELRLHWLARASRPGMPAEDRRGLGFQLLEAGYKPDAEAVFRELAQAEPPNGENMRQLLYLWGPRPDAVRLDWLEARARSTHSVDRAAWLDLLVQVGAPKRAMALYEAAPAAALFEPYVAALRMTKERTKLAAAIAREIDGAAEPQRLFALADLALGEDQTAVAERAWSRVLIRAPDDPIALRQLGRQAYFNQRRGEAERYLGRYLELEPGDWEVGFFMGELIHDRRRDDANGYFRRALAVLERNAGNDFTMRLTRAKILFRLGRPDESVRVFEALTAERPRDRALKGEFAAVLIETNRLDRAARVLAE